MAKGNSTEDIIKAAGGNGRNRGFGSVPLSLLEVDWTTDGRDRTSKKYREHYQKVKAYIVGQQAITATLEAHRRSFDEQFLIMVDGRTSVTAAKEAIAEGLINTPETEFFVPVRIVSGSDLDILARQFNAQETLGFSPLEKANQVSRMYKTAGEMPEKVAQVLSISVQQVEQYLELIYLPERVKQLIIDERVAATTALDASKRFSGDELVNILTSAVEAKVEEAEEHNKAVSPNGQKKSKKLSKTDLRRAELLNDPDINKKMLQWISNIEDVLSMDTDSIDPVLLEKLHDAAMKVFDNPRK